MPAPTACLIAELFLLLLSLISISPHPHPSPASNTALAASHNARFAAGEVTWTLTNAGPHADLTPSEYASQLTPPTPARLRGVVPTGPSAPAAPPSKVDWVSAGAVGPVKDQGECGAPWAYATLGALQGAAFISTAKLTTLSLSELIACVGQGSGCTGGGSVSSAFSWVLTNGIASEAAFPYNPSATCPHPLPPPSLRLKQAVRVKPNNQTLLEYASSVALVTVAVDATSWQLYSGGVLTSNCGVELNHVVLLTGYDTAPAGAVPFWNVQNSWGASWGERGFIRLGLGPQWDPAGQCGLTLDAEFGVV